MIYQHQQDKQKLPTNNGNLVCADPQLVAHKLTCIKEETMICGCDLPQSIVGKKHVAWGKNYECKNAIH